MGYNTKCRNSTRCQKLGCDVETCISFNPAPSCSSQFSGSVSDDNEDYKLEEGVWFKSKTTGRLFAHGHIPQCDIDCIIIDGVRFDRSE